MDRALVRNLAGFITEVTGKPPTTIYDAFAEPEREYDAPFLTLVESFLVAQPTCYTGSWPTARHSLAAA